MIISILRITSLLSVSYTDITNTSASALLWSFLEPAIGITVACAPLMRPLFDKSPLSRKHRSRPGKNGGSSSFERLGEPGHSLNEFERTGASMVTSCGTGDGRGRGGGDEDGQALGEAGGRTGKGSAGIRVQREFYTQ